jgi:hypothetical protein
MSDVAQILGVSGNASSGRPAAPPPPANLHPSRAQQLMGLPNDVIKILHGGRNDLSADLDLPPAVPVFPFLQTKRGEAIDVKKTNDNKAGNSGTSTAIPPANSGSVKVNNKWITIKKPVRKWVCCKGFENPAV